MVNKFKSCVRAEHLVCVFVYVGVGVCACACTCLYGFAGTCLGVWVCHFVLPVCVCASSVL